VSEGGVQIEEIVVRTANPNDITLDETEDIAVAIRALNLGPTVRAVGQERTGYGVTLYEVLRIAVAFGAGKAFTEEAAKKIADVVVGWARKRFLEKGTKRAVYVSIYGPDGVVVSKVIKDATHEPEDRTAQDRETERLFADKKN
jgi:hypothetical protein